MTNRTVAALITDTLVSGNLVPGSEWVIAGEGVATCKWDGTCVLIEDGRMWKRYEVKKGKTPPPGFRPANEVDPNTGKQQGWLPVGDGPEEIDKSGDCWLWTPPVNENGYGVFSVVEGNVLAHRYAYQLLIGLIPSETPELDHACHNRRCVRPDEKHARPATRKQNMENRRGPQKNSTTGIRGVYWDKAREKWSAMTQSNGKIYHVGRYDTPAEAEAAVIAKRRELFTHSEMDKVQCPISM